MLAKKPRQFHAWGFLFTENLGLVGRADRNASDLLVLHKDAKVESLEVDPILHRRIVDQLLCLTTLGIQELVKVFNRHAYGNSVRSIDPLVLRPDLKIGSRVVAGDSNDFQSRHKLRSDLSVVRVILVKSFIG